MTHHNLSKQSLVVILLYIAYTSNYSLVVIDTFEIHLVDQTFYNLKFYTMSIDAVNTILAGDLSTFLKQSNNPEEFQHYITLFVTATDTISWCQQICDLFDIKSLISAKSLLLLLAAKILKMYKLAPPLPIPKQILAPITSNKSLVFLSWKPCAYFKKNLKLPPKSVSVHMYPSMPNTIEKITYLYNALTPGQRIIFDKLHNLISESLNECCSEEGDYIVDEPFCAMLDANPGTGKSTTLNTLACTLRTNLAFVVYQKSLKLAASEYANVCAYTCAAFIQRALRINYYQQINLFNKPLHNCLKILLNCMHVKYPIETENKLPHLLVLDEYTIINPFICLLLYCLCRRWRINLLFVGDRNQQNPITRTIYHRMNNFSIVKHLCGEKVYTLQEQVRMTDNIYYEKIKLIKEILERTPTDLTLDYTLKYKIYELFEEKFHTEENYKAIFIANCHSTIKERTLRLLKKLDNDKIEWYRAEYVLLKKGSPSQIANFSDDNHKFLPYMPLLCDYLYSLTEENGNRRIVRFHRLVGNLSAIVSDVQTNETLEVKRVRTTQENTLNETLVWLLNKKGDSDHIYQFPMKLCNITYSSAQGITVPSELIEVDLDKTSLNSVYVGLTRIREGRQLNKIHSVAKHDFFITKYFNDQYYYRLPTTLTSKVQEHLKELEQNTHTIAKFKKENFKLVSFLDFSRKSNSFYAKILRSTIDSKKVNDSQISELLKLTMFIKDKFDSLVDTNKNVDAIIDDFQTYLIEQQLPPFVETKTPVVDEDEGSPKKQKKKT